MLRELGACSLGCAGRGGATNRRERRLGDVHSAPVVGAAGTVYACAFGVDAGIKSACRAFDSATLALKWEYPIVPDNGFVSTSALGFDAMFVANGRTNRLYALETANNGTERFAVSVGAAVTGAPVVGLGAVYLATEGNGILAFDPRSGAPKAGWKHAVTEPVVQPALLANGDLISATESGRAFVLNRDTGAEIRSLPLNGSITAPIVVGADDTAFFATDKGTYAVTASNSILWESPVSGQLSIGDRKLIVIPVKATANFGPFYVIGD